MTVMEKGTAQKPAYLDGKTKPMLIDGRWVPAASGKTFETRNPATGELLAHVAEGDKEDIDRAVAAARKAFTGPWSKWKPAERQALLLKIAELVEKNIEELASLDTHDMGAPISRTRNNRQRAVGMLRYYAGQATALHGETIENSLPGEIFSFTLKEPVGVVGAIIPWNGPLTATIWKIGPALATGCTVVLKPAEEAPLTSLRLGELCLEAGVPPGVVNVVPGFGRDGGRGAVLAPTTSTRWPSPARTSPARRSSRPSSTNLKRVSLELGGKSPDIVFADADLDAAVPGAAMAVFANSGQICSAGTRLFVEKKVYEEFTDKVAAFSKTLKVGNGANPETQVGPLVSSEQLDRVTTYLGIGRQEGAESLVRRPAADRRRLRQGLLRVADRVRQRAGRYAHRAGGDFRPVISAIPFTDIEEVIKRANATTFGLGSGVWTADVTKALRSPRRSAPAWSG